MYTVANRKKFRSRSAIIQPDNPAIRHISLTQERAAIVDAEDYEWLDQWNWMAHWSPAVKSFYAVRRFGKTGLLGMYSTLINSEKGNVPDHINGDTLDNRRSNLQDIPHGLNLVKAKMRIDNSTGVSGVCFDKSRGKYIVRVANKQVGRFTHFVDAVVARDAAMTARFEGFTRA